MRRGADKLDRSDVALFSDCIRRCKGLSHGLQTHGLIVDLCLESDRFLGNLLVQFYGKCGSFRDARAVFDRMPHRNVFSWSLVISSHLQCKEGHEALNLFRAMLSHGCVPDRVIFVTVTSICADLELLAVGKWMHSFISACSYASDIVLGTALINMYGKCGSLEEAEMAFNNISVHDVISWTALIAAYAQNDRLNNAIILYEQMLREKISPNRVTFACILDACADKAAIKQGKRMHDEVTRSELESDIVVGNALINLYGKCGKLKLAQKAFRRMRYRDVVSWTTMIGAHSQQGKYGDALRHFQTMLSRRVVPDKVAFLIVLSACSHGGLIKQGFDYFHSMQQEYQIAPGIEHYNCMVDLLGRLGQLEEAEKMILEMPLEANATTWMTMLGACNMHSDVKRGEYAAEQVFRLDPENATPYVLLSNLYGLVGRWDDARKTRQRMKDMGLKKQQGHSLIEIDGIVHEFVSGDQSHPKTACIQAELQKLSRQMEEAGYVPDTKVVLHDVEEWEKENILYSHSEKLALVFGVISTPPETSLCIIKNLRICRDCHASMKFISKLLNRKITVRDAIRFHVFKNGVCSCADYW